MKTDLQYRIESAILLYQNLEQGDFVEGYTLGKLDVLFELFNLYCLKEQYFSSKSCKLRRFTNTYSKITSTRELVNLYNLIFVYEQ